MEAVWKDKISVTKTSDEERKKRFLREMIESGAQPSFIGGVLVWETDPVYVNLDDEKEKEEEKMENPKFKFGDKVLVETALGTFSTTIGGNLNSRGKLWYTVNIEPLLLGERPWKSSHVTMVTVEAKYVTEHKEQDVRKTPISNRYP